MNITDLQTEPSRAQKLGVIFDPDIEAKHGWRKFEYTPNRLGIVCSINDRTISTGRLVLGEANPEMLVDHKDGNILNNLRNNLRFATRTQNNQNRKALGGSSIYKGVSLDKRTGNWRATITIGYKQISIGRYSLETDAAKAYDAAARVLHKEFGRYNFPFNTEQSAI